MPRPCTACTHPDRHQIDEALAAGTSYRSVAKRFGLSLGAVSRHKANHMIVVTADEPLEGRSPELPPTPGPELLARIEAVEGDVARLQKALELLSRAVFRSRTSR